MKKNFNIDSAEWCDLVFKSKNKAYGAYALRQSSGKRHLVALGTVLIAVVFVAFLPTLISSVKPAHDNNHVTYDETMTVMDIENKVEELEKPQIPEALLEPPKLIAKTLAYVAPKITEDELFNPEKEMTSAVDAMNTDARIGTITYLEGSTDFNAIPKELVMEHNAITEAEPPTKVWDVAEEMPKFPGGDADLYEFISKNLKYPAAEIEAGHAGKVIIRFIVGKDGKISEATVLRGVSPGCDREALRVVNSMPRWVPGRQNGNPVAVYFTLPVVYRLQ